MTIDTIKDVLGRIISINKNLTEDSLRNLLVASGWDNNDIEEGLKVYRNYGIKAETVNPASSAPVATPVQETIVVPQAPVYVPIPAPTQQASAPTPISSAPQIVYTPTVAPVAAPAPVVAPEPQIINIPAETHFIPTPPPFYAPKPVTFSATSLQTSAPINITAAQAVEAVAPEIKNPLPIVTTEDHPKSFSSIALGVDIVLFLLTLGLLVYVVTR
jgi:hypothetical protein